MNEHQLLADDVIEDYPQSGERMRGKANRRVVYENYPGSVPSKNALSASIAWWVAKTAGSSHRVGA